jgi:hypothetical protein
VTEGRYGGRHQWLRKHTKQAAYGTPCCRCGRPMLPGEQLDLDHEDDGVNFRGWAHAFCNRQAGGINGNRVQRMRKQRRRIMLTDICLGVEISEDRQHTSIAAAGHIDGDRILVELLHYLDGTNPVEDIQRLLIERQVRMIAVDPRSPGATTGTSGLAMAAGLNVAMDRS